MLTVTELEQMLESMVRSGASTLLIAAGSEPCLRMQESLVRAGETPVGADELWVLLGSLISPDDRARLRAGAEIDSLYTAGSGVRFRQSVAMDRAGPTLVYRSLPAEMPTLDALGLPASIASFMQFRSGIVLVTGFLGSGRSMTLAALVDSINKNNACHIATIEQPIEYLHASAESIVHQREVGRQIPDFATGIRDAVRQSCDVVMVGDVRDRATALAAIDAAERGCLVLAALQASSVVGSLKQLMAMDDAGGSLIQRLAMVLRVVMSQALLRRSHGRGRVPLLEILVNDPAVAKAIRNASFDALPELMERGRGLGMQTMDRGLSDLLDRHLISEEEALYHASDRERVYRRARTS